MFWSFLFFSAKCLEKNSLFVNSFLLLHSVLDIGMSGCGGRRQVMDLLPQDKREMIRGPYKGHAGSAEEDGIMEEVVAYRKDHTS